MSTPSKVPVLFIEGPWYGCACGKRATTFYRGGQWCDDCYPGWDAVKGMPHSSQWDGKCWGECADPRCAKQ